MAHSEITSIIVRYFIKTREVQKYILEDEQSLKLFKIALLFTIYYTALDLWVAHSVIVR